MEYIAHRGCADQFPENTLQAIRSVTDHVDRIEIDVFQCGSGEIILFHDQTTDALTDESYDVMTTDYDTLRKLTVLGSDEHIPVLSDVLDVIPSTTAVQIDLKHPELTEAVQQITDEYDHDIYLCSTTPEIITEATERPWTAYVGYVAFAHFQNEDVDPRSVTASEREEAIETASDLGCTFVEIPYELCVQTDIVAETHEVGLDVVAWTIRTREQLEAVRQNGVDGAMVDRIDIL